MTQLIILGLHCIFICSLVTCALETWQEWDRLHTGTARRVSQPGECHHLTPLSLKPLPIPLQELLLSFTCVFVSRSIWRQLNTVCDSL